MYLTEEDYDYIKGNKFSKGYRLKIKGDDVKKKDKICYLSKILQNKSVIHLGCTDHLECIDDKIKNNVWMHKIITSVSNKCVGLDINGEAINYLKKNYENEVFVQNIYEADITSSFLKDHEITAEYLLLGEILEHISNPCDFIKEIIQKNRNNIDKIIITVPNMYNIYTKIFSWFNIEEINTDHKYWFSPFTLWKVADDAGIKVTHIEFASSPITKEYSLRNLLKIISKYLFEWKPLYRKHLILIGEIKDGV